MTNFGATGAVISRGFKDKDKLENERQNVNCFCIGADRVDGAGDPTPTSPLGSRSGNGLPNQTNCVRTGGKRRMQFEGEEEQREPLADDKNRSQSGSRQ